MLNFCVVTSHEEINASEITFLKDHLKAERVDVLGCCGVQFQVHPDNITEELKLERSKKIDINFITEDERSVHLLEIGAGYKPAEIKINKEVSEKCIMFVYPEEPTIAISDSFISTRDNIKEWLNP